MNPRHPLVRRLLVPTIGLTALTGVGLGSASAVISLTDGHAAQRSHAASPTAARVVPQAPDLASLSLGRSVAPNGRASRRVLDEEAIRFAPGLRRSARTGGPSYTPARSLLEPAYAPEVAHLSGQTDLGGVVSSPLGGLSGLVDQTVSGGLSPSGPGGLVPHLSGFTETYSTVEGSLSLDHLLAAGLPGIDVKVLDGLDAGASSSLDLGALLTDPTYAFGGQRLSGQVGLDHLLTAQVGSLGLYAVDGARVSELASLESVRSGLTRSGLYSADSFRSSGGAVLSGLAGVTGPIDLGLIDQARLSGLVDQGLDAEITRSAADLGGSLDAVVSGSVQGAVRGPLGSSQYVVDSLRLSDQVSAYVGSSIDRADGTVTGTVAGLTGVVGSVRSIAGSGDYSADVKRLSGEIRTSLLGGLLGFGRR